MGVEASYQAIPEDCDLLRRARKDAETAEMMPRIHQYITAQRHPAHEPGNYGYSFWQEALKLVKAHPGLEMRYFYAGGRCWDHILYLLSPARRADERETIPA